MPQGLSRRGTTALLGVIIMSAMMACGGGGGGDSTPTPAPAGTDAGGGGSAGAGSMPNYVAWWIRQNNYIERQTLNQTSSDTVYGLSGNGDTGDWMGDFESFAGTGGDAAAYWVVPVDVQVGATRVRVLSAAKAISQRAAGQDPSPEKIMLVNGVLKTGSLSHGGRYLAGAWATTGQASIDQRWLGIIDLQAPDDQAVHAFRPPAGDTERVKSVQWVSDNQMVVLHESGKKVLWTVGSDQFGYLKDPPAQFQGYSILTEFVAPDGLKYGGLMSKDGGQTHEVWISDTDYSNMRQITNAGLNLYSFKWMASSKAIKIGFSQVPGGPGNRCGNSMFNPEGTSMLSAQQLAATPTPSNLPCDFFASLMP